MFGGLTQVEQYEKTASGRWLRVEHQAKETNHMWTMNFDGKLGVNDVSWMPYSTPEFSATMFGGTADFAFSPAVPRPRHSAAFLGFQEGAEAVLFGGVTEGSIRRDVSLFTGNSRFQKSAHNLALSGTLTATPATNAAGSTIDVALFKDGLLSTSTAINTGTVIQVMLSKPHALSGVRVSYAPNQGAKGLKIEYATADSGAKVTLYRTLDIEQQPEGLNMISIPLAAVAKFVEITFEAYAPTDTLWSAADGRSSTAPTDSIVIQEIEVG
jgi:hypothetical protein